MAKVGTIEAVITAKVEPLRRALNDATKGFVQFEGRVMASQKQAQRLSNVLNREVAQATNKAERGVKSLATSTLTLGRAIGAVAAAWASSRLVQGLNDFARAAHEAEAGARVFEKMLARVGESSRRVEPELQALADELRVAPEIIRSNAAELLRAGYTWDQIATIYRGAGASALLAGRSTAEGIDIATSALVSGLSTYLNQIGIVQNLSTAYTQYARQLGKTAEQLTDAERAEAATLMIHRATAQEVEDLQLLFEGYGGAVSDLNRAWYDFKVTLGSLVMPVVEQVIRIVTRAVELATEAIDRLRQLAGQEPVEALAPVEATVQKAAEAGEDAGREWAVAFAQEANKLVDLIAPGRMFEIDQPLLGVGVIGEEIENVLGPPEVMGGPGAVRDWLGLADATQEELDKVLEVVRSFGTSLQRELDLERELSFALGEPFDEAAVKVRALQRLLRDLVEGAGVPISSPFAQQLLGWIGTLGFQEPAAPQRTLIDQLLGFRDWTPERALGRTLQRLQTQAESTDLFAAEAARREIEIAVSAFKDAFFETRDSAEAARRALEAIAEERSGIAFADQMDGLGEEMEILKARIRSAQKEIEPSLWERLRDAALRFAAGLARGLGGALVQRAPILSDVATAVQTAAPGGPQAMAVAATVALMSHSETFQQLMGVINPLLQALADAVGAVLEPLLPLAVVIGKVLAPVFQAIGVILSTLLLPVLSLLFEPLKWLGIVVLYLGRGISWVLNKIIELVNFVIRAYNMLLGWLTGKIKELKTIDLDTFDDAIEKLKDITWDEAQAIADLGDAARETAEALRNVPQGFKIALRRFQVQDPVPMAEGGIVTSPTIALIGEAGPEAVVPLGGDGAALGTTIIVQVQGPVYGMDDFDRRVQEAVAKGARRAGMATYGLARG